MYLFREKCMVYPFLVLLCYCILIFIYKIQNHFLAQNIKLLKPYLFFQISISFGSEGKGITELIISSMSTVSSVWILDIWTDFSLKVSVLKLFKDSWHLSNVDLEISKFLCNFSSRWISSFFSFSSVTEGLFRLNVLTFSVKIHSRFLTSAYKKYHIM